MQADATEAVLIQTISDRVEIELREAIIDLRDAGITCNVRVTDPGPQAMLEWLLPTAAMIIWFGDKYFGAMLEEAGKDHYQLIKAALKKIFNKTLLPDATVKRVRQRSDGSIISDKYFSGNLSFVYTSPEGWLVKLLFPLDVSAAQYGQSCDAFAALVTMHARDPASSPLEVEVQSTAARKCEGYPTTVTPAHMRPRVRLLVYWNAAEGQFYVPDPMHSGRTGTLLSWPLGVGV